MLKELLASLIENEYFNLLKLMVLPYLEELKNYHFSFLNPLFWLFLLISLLILSKRWGLGKSASFCALVAAVLLGTTALANHMAATLAQAKIFDFEVLRMVSLFVISLIAIYYFFIKGI